MVKKEECAWITKDGFCRWHREPCCRTTPGACAECVRRAHSCKDAYCWIKKGYDRRSVKGRMQFNTRNVSGGVVFSPSARGRRVTRLGIEHRKLLACVCGMEVLRFVFIRASFAVDII